MFGLRVTPRLGPQPEHQERMQILNLTPTRVQTPRPMHNQMPNPMPNQILRPLLHRNRDRDRRLILNQRRRLCQYPSPRQIQRVRLGFGARFDPQAN